MNGANHYIKKRDMMKFKKNIWEKNTYSKEFISTLLGIDVYRVFEDILNGDICFEIQNPDNSNKLNTELVSIKDLLYLDKLSKNDNNLYFKEYEMELDSRPFRIYWHNKFLRSCKTEEEMHNGLDFFTKFLVDITSKNVQEYPKRYIDLEKYRKAKSENINAVSREYS